MLVSKEGRIAFHALRTRPDGGLDFVQYGFDGEILETIEARPATIERYQSGA
jgi:hypothetical protein